MAIRDWPIQERPREKLVKYGAASLSDAELLAIFLRTGAKGLSALDLARNLLLSFDGVRGILEADQELFCQQFGLGMSKYALLQAVLELAQRHMQENLSREDVLSSSKLTKEYVQGKMRSYSREVFLCLFMDSQNRLIAQEELFHGTIDSSMVHPREIVKRALHHNAAALIFAHNHPSGVSEPSQADVSITRRLKMALDMVDIKALDHLVVGDVNVTSLAERGLM